jgi:hypothetical protein
LEKKICSLCGGHLIISMNFLARNWEGYLCLLLKGGRETIPPNSCTKPSPYWGVGIRTLPFICLMIST